MESNQPFSGSGPMRTAPFWKANRSLSSTTHSGPHVRPSTKPRITRSADNPNGNGKREKTTSVALIPAAGTARRKPLTAPPPRLDVAVLAAYGLSPKNDQRLPCRAAPWPLHPPRRSRSHERRPASPRRRRPASPRLRCLPGGSTSPARRGRPTHSTPPTADIPRFVKCHESAPVASR
jgi:hypothetical protein